MKKLVIIFCLAVFAWMVFSGAIQEKQTFSSYQEMRTRLGELFNQNKFAEAAALLESVLDQFPDNVAANTYNLAFIRLSQGDAEKAMAALEDGLRRGVFYGLWDFDFDAWAPLKKHERFSAFAETNKLRAAEAQKKASLKIEVETPEGYDPAKKYPLFLALHGGGEAVADFKPLWVSPRLKKEFIVAYLQSPQVASMTGFHWQDEAQTKRDVETGYKQVLETYSVDESRVLIGGFSSGGFASIIVAFSGAPQVRGFVALCPVPPETLRDEDIAAAKSRGLRGTLLTTEQDGRVELQKALVDRLQKSGLAVEFYVTPNIGHWFPADFGERLDQAIGKILDADAGK